MENSINAYEWIYDISSWVLPIVIAITFHEAAHGWVASKMGDNTAKIMGRVTFNPLKHVDRFGTIILPGLLFLLNAPFLFGYAKPVPVNFSNLKPRRAGMVLVALAGPGVNILLALAAAFGISFLEIMMEFADAPWLYDSLYKFIAINVVLAVFNMIPLPPLDGGRVLAGLLPGSYSAFFGRVEKYGFFILMLLFILPALLQDYAGISVPIWEYMVGKPMDALLLLIYRLAGIGEV